MEHTENFVAPEASTDEHASPVNPRPEPTPSPDDWPEFATREEAMAYWQGVRRGVRDSGRDRAHPHMPESFPLDLTRDGGAPSLTSSKLLDPWPHIPDDEASKGLTTHGPAGAKGRAPRHDGFTVEAEQLFLRTLADTGIVADACRATGVSRQAAYARRRSAAGRAFSLAWDAAQLISRGAVQDDVLSRARHGVIERVYRDGQLVAERHRYDNRLTMAVLARLDRQAEGHGANAPVIRAVAREFDQFLGLLPHGLEAAEDFVAARFPIPPQAQLGEGDHAKHGGGAGAGLVKEPAGIFGRRPATGSEEALLARLGHYGTHGVGLPMEIDIDDLDSEEMESWTDDQWDRAQASGFLEMLSEREWPDAARNAAADGTNGMCKIRQLYLRHHPPAPPAPEPEDDFGGCDVWDDETHGWLTDFPPPPGFGGYEEGEPGNWGYERELTPEERAVIEEDEALEREQEDARLADLESARRRYFGLDEATNSAPAEGAIE